MQLPPTFRPDAKGMLTVECKCVIDGIEKNIIYRTLPIKVYQQSSAKSLLDHLEARLRADFKKHQLVLRDFRLWAVDGTIRQGPWIWQTRYE